MTPTLRHCGQAQREPESSVFWRLGPAFPEGLDSGFPGLLAAGEWLEAPRRLKNQRPTFAPD